MVKFSFAIIIFVYAIEFTVTSGNTTISVFPIKSIIPKNKQSLLEFFVIV